MKNIYSFFSLKLHRIALLNEEITVCQQTHKIMILLQDENEKVFYE
jgi:hypothetical protein